MARSFTWRNPWRLAAGAVFGAVLMGVCAWAQYEIAHRLRWPLATPLQLLAAFGLARLLRPSAPPAMADEADTRSLSSRERLLAWTLGASGVALYLGAVSMLTRRWDATFDTAAPAALGGVLVWSAGLALGDRRRGRFYLTGSPIPRAERWAMAAVILVALWMRFYRFDFFPPADGISTIEEAQTGMWGLHIIRGHRPWEFLLDRWTAAAALAAGGSNPTALRLPFAAISTLTVLFLYWLLRCLVHRWVAVLTAALFAVCHWHLIYARYAHNIFLTTAIVILILFLLFRARLDGRLAFYPAAGFLTGLTLYAYAGYRGTFLLVAALLAIGIWRPARLARASVVPSHRHLAMATLRRRLAGAVLTISACVLLIPPLLVQVRRNPNYSYFEAARRSLVNEQYYTSDAGAFVAQRLRRIRDTAMIFNHQGDRTFTMNSQGEPMLDPYVGGVFVVAFAYCMLAARRFEIGYFFGVFLFLLAGGAVFVQNLDVRRLQGVIPILYVLVAFLLDRLRAVAAGRGRRKANWMGAALGLALFCLSAVSNYAFFFHRFIYDNVVRRSFKNSYTLGITHLHSLPPNSYELQVSDITNFFLPSDYEWWRGNDTPGMVTTDLVPLLNGKETAWAGRDVYVALYDPYDDPAVRAALVRAFPGAGCEAYQDPDNMTVHVTSCHVGKNPPRRPGVSRGVRARYYRGHETRPFIERTEPAVAFAFTPDACRSPRARLPCRVEWEGIWDGPAAGLRTLALTTRQPAAATEIRLDGEPLTGQLHVGPGLHHLRLSVRYPGTDKVGARLDWYNPATRRRELAPLRPGNEAR